MSDKKKIFYIHDYDGSPDDIVGTSLKELFGDRYEIIRYGYWPENCEFPIGLMADMGAMVWHEKPDIIIGYGLGGFMASLFNKSSRLLINPIYEPTKMRHIPDREKWKRYEDKLKDNKDEEWPVIGCFSNCDEVCGQHYWIEFSNLHKNGKKYQVPGTHEISKEVIEDFLIRNVKRIEEKCVLL